MNTKNLGWMMLALGFAVSHGNFAFADPDYCMTPRCVGYTLWWGVWRSGPGEGAHCEQHSEENSPKCIASHRLGEGIESDQPSEGRYRVTCDDAFLVRPWGDPGTFMTFKKNQSQVWEVLQKGMNCTFEDEAYGDYKHFRCESPALRVSLDRYERKCEPSESPHHEKCHYWAVVNYSYANGSDLTEDYYRCNFDLKNSDAGFQE